MKKNVLKRVGGMALALVLAVGGLSACGKDTGTSGAGGGAGGGGGAGASGNGGYSSDSPAKQHVYGYQELKLPEMDGDDIGFRSSSRKGDKIYLLMQVYHWDQNSQTDYRLLTMNADGSDIKSIALTTPTKLGQGGDGTEGDGAEGETGTEDESGTEDGGQAAPQPRVAMNSAASSIMRPVPDVGVDEEQGGNIWEYEYMYFGNFCFGEGGLYATKDYNYTYEDYDNPENSRYEQATYICFWDYEGNYLWETQLEGLRSDEEYIYVNTIAEDADGNPVLLMTGNSCYQQSVSTEGVLGERKALNSQLQDVFNYSNNLMPVGNGKLLVVYYGQDYSKQYLAEYDISTGVLGEPSALPERLSWSGYSSMGVGLNSDLVYTTSDGVFTLNIGETEGTQKLNFINSDLDITNFQSMVELGEDTIFGVYYDNFEGKSKAGIFTYIPPEEIPDKKVLVLAGYYVGYDMRHRVVEFNRASQEYKITIKDYNQYNTNEDYNAGQTALNNDIITGNIPDIIVLTNRMPISNFVAKGLLADIGKLIENDEELSKKEFVQNVFDAYSVKGKLYQVLPSFDINTMIAKKSLVGDRTSWTMDDMKKVLASMPEGAVAIEGLTRDWFFSMMMQYCGRDFVDVDTGRCNFNSENFIALMEFAKSLPEQINYDEDYWMSYNGESQYRENRTLLYTASIYRVSELNRVINGYFGEDVSFVGFPTDGEQGGVVSIYNSYGISAKSQYIDGAWQFLRYYLTDEYQNTLTYDLPVVKNILEEKAKEALSRPYYTDWQTGEKVEYDESFYINGEEFPLPPMSQAQLDQIMEYIYSVKKAAYFNDDVTNIINEEMGAFFSGQKEARDVANIIQNKVQLFVDENS